MVPPIENPNNKPVIDVKAGLAELRATINPASQNEDANNPTKAKMDEVKLKINEAKTAAAQADKTALEDLSREIDATDAPLDEFISSGYFYDEALGFKAEVQQLKAVVTEKIAEPRTTMEKIGSMMEKAGETLGKVMEKIGKIFERMGTGALKGLRSLAEIMGFTSALAFLDGMIKPREVRDIISARFRPKKCVKSDTDTADVARLEAEWAAKLTADGKTAAAYPFSTFCTEKATALPDDPAKTEYTIADLITNATPPAPPPVPPPNPKQDPSKPPEGMLETPEHQKAKYTYALAEAFNMVASGTPYTGFVDMNRDVIESELKSPTPGNYKTIINRMLREMDVGFLANAPLSSRLFGIALDDGVLEEEDWNNWADINIDANFEANMRAGNVKSVIDTLKAFTYTDDISKVKMPLVIKALEKSMEKYGII